ncbi:MAG: DUF3696 domain-containing protein [Rhodobacteraceae bacterium]|nr:DUF3696 domain-containing protein [Paracoccaceae bacterium]
MIAEVRLENFKRFRELTLKTANLTVLTGANGAGKSSVLHALLLARQAAKQPEKGHVELSGVDNLALGGVQDVINHEAVDDRAAIEVLDTCGTRRRWSFEATSAGEARTLNAAVAESPDEYAGALSGSAPQFSYLCAERLGPRDVLGASASSLDELDVGSRGEFVAHVLASLGRSRIRDGRIEDRQSASSVASLLHQTESWMGRIVRPTQIEAEWIPHTSITRLRFKRPGLRSEWTRAPNEAFGISYVLPIVVAALRAETGGLLIVENPEAHLHPSGQSQIGRFLARIAADGVQVIIETHSDHVLNGIRVAVADGSAEGLAKSVAIHFFQVGDDGYPTFQTMELERSGQLTAWPAGFFDQTLVDLALLASRRARKR